MNIKRMAAVAASSLALAVVPLTGASANPAQACAGLADMGLSRGACASTIAQNPGVTDPRLLKPSNAAYVANCKQLERTPVEQFGFVQPDGTVYPHQFYKGTLDNVGGVVAMLRVPVELAPIVVKNYQANAALFTAKNRAGCVKVLKGLHSGALFSLLFAGFPDGPAE